LIFGYKLKGVIAEQAAILQALKRGWGVLKAIGDRLPYDLVFDVDGVLIRVQVKSAWFQPSDNAFVVDNRRTGTNRRIMKRRLRIERFGLRNRLSRRIGVVLRVSSQRIHRLRKPDLPR